MSELQNRYDFVLFFDVKDGNPNGDPDAGNLPRVDPETGQGLVTDVCLKRKLRNYVLLSKAASPGFDIFVKEKAILNDSITAAYKAAGVDLTKPAEGKKKRETRDGEPVGEGAEVDKARKKMCETYFDLRAFGGVLSTGANAGQVRGPVQLTFARSIDPVVTLEHSITRMAVATTREAAEQGGENRTMGRKNTIPYGLYRAHGFISPSFAKQTGFSAEDLDMLWSAIENMFEHDRSAARGLMTLRKLICFKHSSPLGDAPAHRLFEAVSARRREPDRPSREFADYEIALDRAKVSSSIEVIERVA
jgi:CRISPR-associated protein Csd2